MTSLKTRYAGPGSFPDSNSAASGVCSHFQANRVVEGDSSSPPRAIQERHTAYSRKQRCQHAYSQVSDYRNNEALNSLVDLKDARGHVELVNALGPTSFTSL